MDAYVGATVSYVTHPRGRVLTDTLGSLVDATLAAFRADEPAKKKATKATRRAGR